ncbi:VWA domain-containing protein [Psychroflexus sediminis]|uniref:Ca-activated chloride channel family protein n=1 Tax=Psychroflexus sediminis TaxID=470826 RepID=A0A1G7X3W5_9FLAO|nr:VWA domain-containing protein [Psychroflexus sediminis]SDG78889.1 Ca-activated chloride channel family protein [Psychroflexus sediminis]
MILEEQIYFWGFLVLPVLLLLFLTYAYWKKKTQKKFAENRLFKKLAPDQSRFKSNLKFLVLSLAFACFVMALVNPKLGTKLETVKREGVDIVFALDVSKSMLAEDIAPNRLEKSKRIITEIINNLAADRVGLVGYAGSAFPQVPITTDYSTTKTFLQSMNTEMVSSQGTAISQAIDLATSYYNDDDQTNKVLIILSEGEDHSDNAISMAEQAAEEGIRIYTVGVGTERGGPIPIKENGRIQSYLKNDAGETVITKKDTETLRKIAEIGNGAYIDGSSTSEAVDEILKELQKIEKTEFEAKQFADFKSKYQWFLGFGIFLVLIDILLLERKTSWVRQLNLFNERKNDET